MSGYFRGCIANTDGVKADADANDSPLSLEEQFEKYMLSPFAAIQAHDWLLAYGPEVGITSGFGHLIDHMAMSGPLKVASSKVLYLTNQKFGNKPPDTDLQL